MRRAIVPDCTFSARWLMISKPIFSTPRPGVSARARLERRRARIDGVAQPDRRLEVPGEPEQAKRRAVDPVELGHEADRHGQAERPMRDAPAIWKFSLQNASST